MKSILNSSRRFHTLPGLFLLFGAGTLCAAALYNLSAPAASVRSPVEKDLKAAVAELQHHPANRPLREHIFELARAVRPPVPEEALRHLHRGLDMARDPNEQTKIVAAEFKQALRAAPWWSEPYYQLAAFLQARGNYEAARRAFALYLVAAPDAEHSQLARQQIILLESMPPSLQNQTSCIECNVHCTPNGIDCCGTCTCDAYTAPSGQTFWKCLDW